MNKKTLICAACAALCLSSVPFSVSAAESGDYVYGTMDIPYADFYKGEFKDSSNAYDVDAVSSATAGKWKMNEEGKLCEGTFNEANAEGDGGKILGVTYPVAVKKDDLSAVTGKMNFTETSDVPAAYKVVSVDNGTISFSEVKDSTPEKLTGEATITANTAWGDYLVNVKDKPEDMGAISGAVIKTKDGKAYGMRHLENIWRGELAWSSGVKKTEPHGNELSYENFKDLMGATISEVVYITKNGYYTAETDLYVPYKFEATVTVENAAVNSGKTTFKAEGIPADFSPVYSAGDLDVTVNGDTINFKNAKPGSYTLTIEDKNGKYASVSGTFTLTTDKMPAAYENGAIVKAKDASDEDYKDFMSKISKITVNEKAYNASGRGAVKIVKEDGTIDMDVASREVKVFDGSDKYNVTVEATGYEKKLEFVIDTKAAEVTTTAAVTEAAPSTTTAKAGATTTAKVTAANVSSTPKTGDTSNAMAPVFALVMAGAAATLSLKRKNNK